MKQNKGLGFLFIAIILSLLIYLSYDGGKVIGIPGISNIRLGIDIKGGIYTTLYPDLPEGQKPTEDELNSARGIIEKRLESKGIFDKNVAVEKEHGRIIVEIPFAPGEEDFNPQKAIEEIGRTALLTFQEVDVWHYEYVSGKVPEGMGVFVCPTSGFLEVPKETLFGYENLSYLLYDDPALVKAVVDRVGELVYGFYEKLIGLPNLAGFFQGDDMGYKSSTLVSPKVLREYILPWHKKLAKLAHDNGLIYMLHCCGNIESIMGDLINDVKIDAKHSFEDEAMPVTAAKKKYGDKIGILGGVDVDKLCRLPEDELRKYVRNILETCMPGGRYALGSGNTVANYVPVKNYLIMLEEGINFG
jgi:uroporphyrinogen decarboxylase